MREQSEYIPYTFTDEEFRAIIHAADEFLGNRRGSTKSSRVFPMLLRMLYGCGLRLGEALALRWENVDLGAGILHIKKAKNNKERDVPMDPSLTSLLETYKNGGFLKPRIPFMFLKATASPARHTLDGLSGTGSCQLWNRPG